MKKTFVCITLVVFFMVFGLSLNAGDKKINLFGNVGYAFSDIEGLCFDVGGELQLTENIYAQVLFDYYLNPIGEDIEGVDDSAYGINLYGVYKFTGSGSLNFFAKAGVHYTTIKASTSIYGVSISATDSNMGIGGGLGVEYSLSEKMALVFGGTVKMIFSEGDTGTWFKLYGGLNFQVN